MLTCMLDPISTKQLEKIVISKLKPEVVKQLPDTKQCRTMNEINEGTFFKIFGIFTFLLREFIFDRKQSGTEIRERYQKVPRAKTLTWDARSATALYISALPMRLSAPADSCACLVNIHDNRLVAGN